MRLIDADALIGTLHNYGFYDGNDRTMVYGVIRLQPTIEPEPQKGKWIDVDPHGDSGLAFRCSGCGEISIRESRYCPNCGADMKGEQDAVNPMETTTAPIMPTGQTRG